MSSTRGEGGSRHEAIDHGFAEDGVLIGGAAPLALKAAILESLAPALAGTSSTA
jgi:hypothetical protein